MAQYAIPDIGDSMFCLVDRIPQNVMIDEEGEQSLYDVSLMRAPFLRSKAVISLENSSARNHFEDANLVVKSYDNREIYYRRDGNLLYKLGEYGFFMNNRFVPAIVRFSEPIPIAQYPLRLGNRRESSSSASVIFPVQYLHTTIQSQFPIVADSVRVDFEIKDFWDIDGSGSLKYVITYDDVVRQFHRREFKYEFFLRVGDKPWQNFTSYMDLVKLFGPSTVYNINFFSEELALPISSVEVNSLDREPVFLEYHVREHLNRYNREPVVSEPDIYAFPNPAFSVLNVELNNLKPGKYKVIIYDILGREKYRTSVDYISDKTIQIEVGNFEKGPYLYALVDSYGRRMITKRLTVMKP